MYSQYKKNKELELNSQDIIEEEFDTLNSEINSPDSQKINLSEFYVTRQSHFYNLPTQRKFKWDNDKQSLLIHSLIINYPTGSLYVNVNNDKYEFMDGQQRGNTITRMFDNKLKLSDDIPDIKLRDPRTLEFKSYQIAGKTFDELDIEVRNVLNIRTINIEKYYDLDNDVINEMIHRLNNGLQLTNIEKTRMAAHGDLQTFVSNIVNSSFMDRKVKSLAITDKNLSKDKEVYKMIMTEIGIESFSEMALSQIPQKIKERGGLDTEEESRIVNTIDYLNNVFPRSNDSFLTIANIIPIYIVGQRAMDYAADPRKLYANVVKRAEKSNLYKNIKGRVNSYSITMKKVDVLWSIYQDHIKD